MLKSIQLTLKTVIARVSRRKQLLCALLTEMIARQFWKKS